MRKLIAAILAAGVAVAAVAAMHFVSWGKDGHASRFAAHEDKDRNGPPDGDYWAIRVGYGGDPAHLRFEPRWLLSAKAQDRQISAGVPAGIKNYRHSGQSPLSLDPNQFT
ncbi:MAG: hypothetical protein WBV61_07555, partial [Rhodanobacteraceae bacterium]